MTEDRSEQAERLAIRRRWINVGEVVAVAGLIIAALSLYLGWSGRREFENRPIFMTPPHPEERPVGTRLEG